jgi:ABC-type antimicrobial peptide transport system permease subunit
LQTYNNNNDNNNNDDNTTNDNNNNNINNNKNDENDDDDNNDIKKILKNEHEVNKNLERVEKSKNFSKLKKELLRTKRAVNVLTGYEAEKVFFFIIIIITIFFFFFEK